MREICTSGSIWVGLSIRIASEAWATIKGGFYGRFLITYDTGSTWNEYITPPEGRPVQIVGKIEKIP